MIQVFKNKYWILERSSLKPLLVVQRTESPYAHLDDVRRSFAELLVALNSFQRPRFSLLIDIRLAPFRNDPDYEAASYGEPAALSKDFKRVAVLVRTAAGKLQVKRSLQERRVSMQVFDNEGEVLGYLHHGEGS